MKYDFALAKKFLASIDPNKKTWSFVMVKADSPSEYDEFNDIPFDGLAQIVPGSAELGSMAYLKTPEGAFMVLPGLPDLTRDPPVVRTFEEAQGAYEDIKATQRGEWSPPPPGGANGPSEGETVYQGGSLNAVHSTYLKVRGLGEAAIKTCDFSTFTDKKAISKLLGRTTWGSGNVLAVPHRFKKGDEVRGLRLILDNPTNPAATSLWTVPRALPYLPQQALEDGRYDLPNGVTYVTLDELDAQVITQIGYRAIGGEGHDAFIDHQHLADTGEERLHPAITDLCPPDEYTVIFYPRAAGKKRSDALKVARLLRKTGCLRVNLLEVKDGNLRKIGEDRTAFNQLELQAVPIGERELESPYATLRDALGDEILSEAVFEDARALLVPDKYEVDAAGAVYAWTPGPFVNGTPMPQRSLVTRTLTIPVALVKGVETGEQTVILAHKHEGKWKTRHLTMPSISKKALIAGLAAWGIHASDHNAHLLVGWFHDFLEVNMQHQRMKVLRGFRRTGWHQLEDETWLYAYPGQTDGLFERPAGEDDGTHKFFKARAQSKGTREKQIEAVREVVKYPAGRMNVMAAFAATLSERMPGGSSRILHSYGTTTGGKTLFVFCALSLFGAPNKMFEKGTSTIAGIEAMMSSFSGTYVLIDELTTQTEDRMSEMLYTVIDGRSKLRSTRTGGMREAREWRAFVATTAEKPLSGKDTHQGANARVLNLRCQPHTTEFLTWLSEIVNTNYGHFTKEWVEHLHKIDFEEATLKWQQYIREGRARAEKIGMNSRNADAVADLRLAHWAIYPLYGKLFGLPDDDGQGLIDILEGRDHLAAEVVADEVRAFELLQSHILANPAQVVGLGEDAKGPVFARVRAADGAYCIEKGLLSAFLQKANFNPGHIRQRWEDVGLATQSQIRTGNVRPRYYVFKGEYFNDNVAAVEAISALVGDSADAATDSH